jgi:hypothetical protein
MYQKTGTIDVWKPKIHSCCGCGRVYNQSINPSIAQSTGGVLGVVRPVKKIVLRETCGGLAEILSASLIIYIGRHKIDIEHSDVDLEE